MSTLTPELEAEFDRLAMELRGYEVARRTETGWERVAAYRPHDVALAEAKRTAAYLNWKWKARGHEYRVRPVVSLDVEFLSRPAPLGVPVGELEKALVEPEQLALPAPESAEEESLIAKPDGEYHGTGFVVPDKDQPGQLTEVPYNYDQLAGSIDIPDPWGDDGGTR